MFEGLQGLVIWVDLFGWVVGMFWLEQVILVEEVFEVFMINVVMVMGFGVDIGFLIFGKLVDFVILEWDVIGGLVEEIVYIEVVLMWFVGCVVYEC